MRGVDSNGRVDRNTYFKNWGSSKLKTIQDALTVIRAEMETALKKNKQPEEGARY